MSRKVLTLDDVIKAKERMEKQPEPDECPVCKRSVTNICADILYITLDRQVCCLTCFHKINTSIIEGTIDDQEST